MPHRKAYLQIHICVLLWGFTAILGKLISLDALPLVWWRMVLVIAVLLFVPRVWRALRVMRAKLIWTYAGIGILIALHWLTFYGSIKLSNASVGATCIALGPVFLSLIEPLMMRRRFAPKDFFLGAAMVPGVALAVGGVPSGMYAGLVVGAISALLVAVFGTLNKHFVEHADPLAVTAIELGSGAFFFTILAPLVPHVGPAFPIPGPRDAFLLVVLALACTLLPFTLSLIALRHLSAFSAQLAVNLEPLYAIVIALAFLGEHRELGTEFYIGVAIILGVVLTYPFLGQRRTT